MLFTCACICISLLLINVSSFSIFKLFYYVLLVSSQANNADTGREYNSNLLKEKNKRKKKNKRSFYIAYSYSYTLTFCLNFFGVRSLCTLLPTFWLRFRRYSFFMHHNRHRHRRLCQCIYLCVYLPVTVVLHCSST